MVRVRPTGVRRGSHTRFLGRGTQMDAPDTVLRGQNSTAGWPSLYMAFKVGKKDWKLSLGDGQCPPPLGGHIEIVCCAVRW
ncbi:hypothetical protein LMG9964_06677 [Paraburkholderia phenoliruptrix]|uniref:Uncharacterized protein n=1 Tax=Paraburkholderia phenoliruptrix TaxID=252970 RepID=A0A6J5KG50_9BURK|nr:hypothetical protein LMG9964_06677 [Paraburkholderia phenoliruptrix]